MNHTEVNIDIYINKDFEKALTQNLNAKTIEMLKITKILSSFYRSMHNVCIKKKWKNDGNSELAVMFLLKFGFLEICRSFSTDGRELEKAFFQ